MNLEFVISYHDVISAVDACFDQSDPSIATPMEEMCEPIRRIILENIPHLVTFMTVSGSAYKLSS